jgi:hypothetical protein
MQPVDFVCDATRTPTEEPCRPREGAAAQNEVDDPSPATAPDPLCHDLTIPSVYRVTDSPGVRVVFNIRYRPEATHKSHDADPVHRCREAGQPWCDTTPEKSTGDNKLAHNPFPV